MEEKIARAVIRLTAVARCDGGLRGAAATPPLRVRWSHRRHEGGPTPKIIHPSQSAPVVPLCFRRSFDSIHPAALPPHTPHAHTSALGRRACARARGGYYFWRVREHTRPTRKG